MPLGRKLTPEEIAAIEHKITPIHRVHRISQCQTYLDAEPCPSQMATKTRRETIDKWRVK